MKKDFCLILLCCVNQWIQAQLIETQPMNDTICSGSAASFTCEVSMAADIFQWEHSTNNITWNAIAASDPAYTGESTTTLQISSSAAPGLNMHWYRIIVTDSTPDPEDIDTSNSVQLIVNSVAIPNPTFINPLPCGTTTGSFTIAGLMNGIEYEVHYTFDNMIQPPVLKTAINNQVTITNLLAGTYTSIFVIHQENGCSSNSVGPIELVDPIPSAPTTIKSNPTTCVPPNGSITFNGLNNNWVYVLNYKRDGSPQMDQMINTNASGSYTLPGLVGGTYSEIKFSYNNNECEAIVPGSIVLTPASTPPPTIMGDISVCVGETIQYSAIHPDDYIWMWTVSTQGMILPPSDAQNVMIKWNSSGAASINLTITATNGCSSSFSRPVSVFSNPSVSISVTDNSGKPNDDTLCTGDMIHLMANASGGPMPYTYVWTPGNSGLNPLPISSGGTYSVKVTDNNSCSTTSPNVIISETPTPPLPGVVTPVRYCVGESAVPLTATPINMGILKWIDYPSAPTPQTNIAGSKIFKVTQTASFCESDTAFINVIVHPLPNLTIKVLDNSGEHNDDGIICSDQQVSLIGSGADDYLWQNGATNDTLITFPNYSGGNYSYMVTGSKLYDNVKTCQISKNGVIQVFDNPKSDFTITNNGGPFKIDRNIIFIDESSPGQLRNITKWDWDLDGPSIINYPPSFDSMYDSRIDTFILQYNSPGLKEIYLTVTNDKLCNSVQNKSISLIDANGPNVDIVVSPNTICQGKASTLKDQSTATNDDYILIKWELEINGGHIILPEQYKDSTHIRYNSKIDNFEIEWTDAGEKQAVMTVTQKPKLFPGESINSDVEIIIVKVLPVVDIELDKTFYCNGDTALIRFAGTQGSIVNYQINNNMPEPKNANSFFKVPLPNVTTIQVLETSLDGCINDIDQSIIISPRPIPVVSIIQGESDTVCQDQIYSLLLTEASEEMKWQLNSVPVGTNSDKLDVDTETIGLFSYSVEGIKNGCSAFDSIEVQISTPPSPIIEGDSEVCKDQVINYLAQTPEGTIAWSTIGGGIASSITNIDSVLVKWTSNGSVILSEKVGVCEESDTLNVIVDDLSSSPPFNEVVYLKGGGILLYSNQGRIPNLCYQWYINGNAIPGDTFQGIVIGLDTTHIREYSVEVYYCDDTQRECKQFIGYRSSAVEEESVVFSSKVYPDPNDGAFNVDIETPIEGDFEITAFDFSGRKIFRTQVHLDAGIQTIPLTMYNVSGGMYLLRTQDIITGQFVVAKVLIVK